MPKDLHSEPRRDLHSGLQSAMPKDLHSGLQCGDAEGLALGKAEGEADGVSEGLALGEAEGLALGAADGAADGVSEGVEVGDAEGEAEGRALGLAEGAAEGEAEGMIVMLNELVACNNRSQYATSSFKPLPFLTGFAPSLLVTSSPTRFRRYPKVLALTDLEAKAIKTTPVEKRMLCACFLRCFSLNRQHFKQQRDERTVLCRLATGCDFVCLEGGKHVGTRSKCNMCFAKSVRYESARCKIKILIFVC